MVMISLSCFDKTDVLLSSVKTSARFFQFFVPFSEKLDFTHKKFESEIILDNNARGLISGQILFGKYII